jgi:hypothetical protein
MFLWIAVCSAIVGAALVVSFFFGRQLLYNEKVLAAKLNTVSTLDHNIKVVPELRDAIRVLETNQALGSVKANQNDQSVQVVLDALPSGANSLALSASFQQRLLAGVDGATIETLSVDPVVGVESEDTGAATATQESSSISDYSINFRFTVNGNTDALKKVLQNLERSIRLIDITTLGIETGQSRQQLIVTGRAYYEPAKQLELTNKAVKQ